MFILAPLLLIFISVIGISVIVLRKKSYLNKIYSLNTAGSNGSYDNSGFSWASFFADFLPEFKVISDRIEISRYKAHWLVETEKFLRRARVVFLRIDRISDGMITKVRKIHVNQKLNGLAKKDIAAVAAAIKIEHKAQVVDIKLAGSISMPFLKNEEERLIIEIAKNPKNSILYEQLGDVYTEMTNFTDAKESYEAAIELNSQNESLKQKLSSALAKLNPSV